MKRFWLSFLLCFLLAPSILVSASDVSSVSIDMEYIIVKPTEDGSLALMHMTNVKNTLEKDYKGDGQTNAVLNFTIPKGATNLEVHDNSFGMTETNTGFFTTKAIPAKESIILPFSYWLKKNNNEFELKYSYPVVALKFLVPEKSGSLTIKGLDYTIQGLFEFEGEKYYGYNIKGVEADRTFSVIYDRDKQPSPEEIQNNSSENSSIGSGDNPALGKVTHSSPIFHNPGHIRMWYQSPMRGFEPHVLMSVLVVIIIGGIGYYSYFRWKNKLEDDKRLADKDEQVFLQLIAKRKAIMDKIIELEENYAGGQISDDEYQKKLDAYKHHLLQVKLNLQPFTK